MSLYLFWRGVLAVLTVAVLGLSLMPSPPVAEGLGWDKANHAAAMLLLTVLAYLALRPARRAVILAGSYTLLLGVLIEVLQGVCTTTRSAEWGDLVADIVGIAGAMGLVILWTCRKTRSGNGSS
ncbi:VanZ family protein [Trichlorobacter ammonificans]|uniref:VanZ-like domain-containing protein n=1 Tax=Trichlorobacter ammonificans TaxID=2916410 RepID=A0ABM9DAW7_9BACT|nr:VanZ family protein [Trichlorobacter ammonificans]CAH2032327.1 conserved membrane protein of unknown function [Trichlorobacter ammonificans]